MKRTLILMRHAKSSWDSPTDNDHDRPLNDRGIQSARALGHWLREQKLIFKDNLSSTEALVSSSLRTQQTFAGLNIDIEPTIVKALYNASSDFLLEALNSATKDTVLIIAHNPGIGELAFRLARMMRDLPSHTRFVDFPTGSTLVVEWETNSWEDLDYSQGKIVKFTTPKELS